MSDPTAYLMVNLMQGVVNEGTAGRLRWKYGLTNNIAGKTGTTNDQSDGWFIGFTPKLTAGVWVGAEDRQVHFESLTYGAGSNMALPIWGIFMQKVYGDESISMGPEDLFVPLWAGAWICPAQEMIAICPTKKYPLPVMIKVFQLITHTCYDKAQSCTYIWR